MIYQRARSYTYTSDSEMFLVAGNEYHEKQKRPLDIQYIASALAGTSGRRYVIGKPFFFCKNELH